MRRIMGLVFGAVFLVACAIMPAVKTVIEASVATCVAEHPDIATEPEMAKVCQYAREYGPIVEGLLGAHKRGVARVAAQRGSLPDTCADTCADAGAKDASK